MEESGAILSAPLGLGALVTTLIGAVPWPVLRETGALLASLKRSRAVLVPLRGLGDVQVPMKESGSIRSASLIGLEIY